MVVKSLALFFAVLVFGRPPMPRLSAGRRHRSLIISCK